MRFPVSMLLLVATLLGGCESAYYGAMEKIGVHKREILVDRIDAARGAQQDAQQQFRDALEQFRAVVAFDGGDLEALYDRLQGEYDDSEAAAERISDRIEAVDDVAQALFDEWEGELDQYTSASLRRDSERKLRDTKRNYAALLATMRRAEASMTPVLNGFHDQVLYLKHNLNASAVASLRGEFGGIEADIGQLIAQMQKSIDEAEAFVRQLRS